MVNWIFNPNDFENKDFSPIPEGDHRVRIADVSARTFNSGNQGFEITLEPSEHSGKLWYYLVLKQDDPKKTNQNIGAFFDSFGITDVNMNNYRGWVGKVGAVRVRHEDYMGEKRAKVAFCVSRKNQEKLPAANFAGAMVTDRAPFGGVEINDDDLPFN